MTLRDQRADTIAQLYSLGSDIESHTHRLSISNNPMVGPSLQVLDDKSHFETAAVLEKFNKGPFKRPPYADVNGISVRNSTHRILLGVVSIFDN